jgi:streptogramin lyase
MTSLFCLRSFACGTAIALCSVLLGCGISPNSDSPAAGTAFSGRVKGGQQPISGAQIFLYEAGASGPGAGAVNLLTNSVFTDSQGNFAITGDYSCSAPAQLYILSLGGNPGLSGSQNNSAILLAAAIGDCSTLGPSSFISVNEVTTVAAAWALAPFLSASGVVGASSTNAVGLQNAFANANLLVNIATGNAGGSMLPAGASIEAAKLYSLANSLSSCVNSDGTTLCNPLFTAATVGTSVPTNTLQAARNVVLNPSNNVSAVFNAAHPESPFAPALSSTPHDWTISITFTGSGLNSPTGLAVDSQGDLWAANYFGGAVTEISPAGQLQSFTDSNLEESFGISIDGSNNIWVTNEQSSYSVNSGNGSITKFISTGQLAAGSPYSAGGVYYPYAIAADTDGSVWVADYGDSTATHLASNGSSLTGSSGYASDSGLPFPGSVALDANHDAWFGAEALAAKVTPSGTITGYSCCNYATGVAVDQDGNVWLADYSGSSLIELGSNGSILRTLTAAGGIDYPNSLAIDGNGNVWVANYHGNTISAFAGANPGPAGTALSPASGYGLDAGMDLPFGIALDASGSVWVADHAMSAVTQFIGLAAPIATPLLGPPKQP